MRPMSRDPPPPPACICLPLSSHHLLICTWLLLRECSEYLAHFTSQTWQTRNRTTPMHSLGIEVYRV